MPQEVLGVLHQHERFVITTHVRPDGDAIGSQVALGRYLQKMGKTVTLLNSDPPPGNMEWLPGIEAVQTFDGNGEHLKAIGGADVLIVVDTNALHRLGDMADAVKASGAVKVLVDHHTGPEDWFDHQFVRDTASSAAELVYELIATDDPDLIDASLAQALYAGIVTDTGSFRYNSVTPHVHRVTAELMERGDLNPEELYTHLYETKTLHAHRLLARTLETIRLVHDGLIGYIYVSQAMLEETGATSEDTEGLVSYVLALEGVRVALIFTETAKGTKISFRSKGELHVNEWARAFGGGGHRNASGAFVQKPLSDTIDAVPATSI